jgi:hypothetical protein
MRDSAQSRGFVRAASLRVLSGFAWPCDPGATLSTSAAVDLEREHAGALQRTLPRANRVRRRLKFRCPSASAGDPLSRSLCSRGRPNRRSLRAICTAARLTWCAAARARARARARRARAQARAPAVGPRCAARRARRTKPPRRRRRRPDARPSRRGRSGARPCAQALAAAGFPVAAPLRPRARLRSRRRSRPILGLCRDRASARRRARALGRGSARPGRGGCRRSGRNAGGC